jgi:hypothetical protein
MPAVEARWLVEEVSGLDGRHPGGEVGMQVTPGA